MKSLNGIISNGYTQRSLERRAYENFKQSGMVFKQPPSQPVSSKTLMKQSKSVNRFNDISVNSFDNVYLGSQSKNMNIQINRKELSVNSSFKNLDIQEVLSASSKSKSGTNLDVHYQKKYEESARLSAVYPLDQFHLSDVKPKLNI